MSGFDRRFGSSLREEPIERPGLVIDDENDTYVILPDGTRVLLDGNGAPGPPGPPGPAGGFALPAAAQVRYVAGTGAGLTGSDSNAGVSPAEAMATLQHAYNDLDDDLGGGIVMLPGDHDVGTGFDQNVNHKLAVFYTLERMIPEILRGVLADSYPVRVVTSQGATSLFKLGGENAIQNGFGFQGIHFDVTDPATQQAILTEDLNNLRVYNCSASALDTSERYMIKSTHPLYDDTSWYRLRDNLCYNLGLATLADGETDGNCNQHEIAGNVLFPGSHSWGVKLSNAQRSWIGPNNIEGGGPGAIWLLEQSKYNYIFGDAGEGALSPYLRFGPSARDNYHLIYGSQSSAVIVDDQGGNNHQLQSHTQRIIDKTASFTLSSVSEAGCLFKVNSLANTTCTLPTNAVLPWGVGKGFSILQEGGFKCTVAGTPPTIRGINGFKTAGQSAKIDVVKIDTDIWIVSGATSVS